jgi:hypothetical protein
MLGEHCVTEVLVSLEDKMQSEALHSTDTLRQAQLNAELYNVGQQSAAENKVRFFMSSYH